MVCNPSQLGKVKEIIKKIHPYETPAWEIHELLPIPLSDVGQGRMVFLKKPLSLNIIVERIKKHLNIPYIRMALAEKYNYIDDVIINTVAICAGSGSGIFFFCKKINNKFFFKEIISKMKADLYLTGEMR